MPEEKRYLKVLPPPGAAGDLSISEIEGEEMISALFRYRLRLRSTDDEIDFAKMIGSNMAVSIEQANDKIKYINGVITRFQQGDSDEYYSTYFAEIRPWLWQLSLTVDSRIFQNQTVLEIIKDVFSNFGFSDFKDKTKRSFAQREYCVQYQETALDFVTRLMEDEGIWYFFEHTEKTHTLVLANTPDTHEDCPGFPGARYVKIEKAIKDDTLIDSVTLEEQLITSKYAAKDYHFETPDTDLKISVDSRKKLAGDYEIYEYPGGFSKTEDGDKIIKRRLEAHEVTSQVLRGDSYCRAFTSGYKFQLKDHYRSEINRQYVLRSLFIHATSKRYFNSFVAFPDDVPFRPLRRVKRPKIYGTQTAIVVGESGEEIFPDEYGRIKVQFHWDHEGKKDENSSCWIRVAQMWAGKNWGTMFIPRIGSEVVVSFLDGNPDKPLIIGSVYNATQTVPYTLPGEKTKSTILTWSSKEGEAGNEIRFEDNKDNEELYLHAQKDHYIKVENDRKLEVIGNEETTITLDRTTTIKEGHETLTVEKGNRTMEVSEGDETYTVKTGTRTLKVAGEEEHTNEAGFTQNVAKNYTLKVDGNLEIDVSGTITIKSGKSFDTSAGADMTNTAKMNLTNDAGKDLTNKSKMKLTNDAGMDLINTAKMNLDNKATMNLTNKGNMNVTNDAGLQAVIKGTMVEVKANAMAKVEGGGMAEVKGGIVKAN